MRKRKWFDSPAVGAELKFAYWQTRALIINSNSTEHRLGALEDLVERLLRLAENRCSGCGAPIHYLAKDSCCSQECEAEVVNRDLY